MIDTGLSNIKEERQRLKEEKEEFQKIHAKLEQVRRAYCLCLCCYYYIIVIVSVSMIINMMLLFLSFILIGEK